MANSKDKNKNAPTIVIRRIKKSRHGGHHGGAWKIAYADFVTAMMAFFLLMWLLGSTTQGDLQGIADYFNSPLKVAMMGGSGSGDSTAIINGGGTDLTKPTGQVKSGSTPDERKLSSQTLNDELDRRDKDRLEAVKAEIEAKVASDKFLKEFYSQIRLDITKEGLRVQIIDALNRPMFDTGKAEVKGYMRDILRKIGHTLNQVDNRITLSGHTDAAPYQSGERGYSNWELSVDRANASRRELIAGGMAESKIYRVIGLASSAPFNAQDEFDPANRRITIIVMNKQLEERLFLSGGQTEIQDAAVQEQAITPGTTQTSDPKAAQGPTAEAAEGLQPDAPNTTDTRQAQPVQSEPVSTEKAHTP